MAFNGMSLEDPAIVRLNLDFVSELSKNLEMQNALEKERELEIRNMFELVHFES